MGLFDDLLGDGDAKTSQASSDNSGGSINVDALPQGLKPYAKDFESAGQKYGIDPNFLAAIAWNETGGGTSRAFRQGNNAMGISNASGPLYGFNSVADSIERQAATLARPTGPYRKASTIQEVGSIYSPVGAANDPYHLNSDWTGSVGNFYDKLTGKGNNAVVLGSRYNAPQQQVQKGGLFDDLLNDNNQQIQAPAQTQQTTQAGLFDDLLSENNAKAINLPAVQEEKPPIPEFRQTPEMGIGEKLGRFFSPLLGPTEQQKFEEAVPVDPNLSQQKNIENALAGVVPENAVYQYKPYANRMEREQGIFTPFVEEIPQFKPNANDTTALAATKGILNTAAGLAGSFMSPGGVLLGGAPKELESAAEGVRQIGRGAAGLFAGQMLSEVPEQVKQAINPNLTTQERVQAGAGAVVGLGLGGLAGKHAIMGEKPPVIPEPEPKLNPSANPIVNEREAAITAAADAQAAVPEPPAPTEPVAPAETTEPTAPAPDINALIAEQLFHEEGSPEHTAIQQQIDALTKTAEAPVAEAQPTEENAVQKQGAREVGVRNAPAVGEGVGTENQPEEATTQGEAPKEEVRPQEEKSSLPEQTQKDFIDIAKKKGGLNKTQAQKALIEYERAGNIKIGDDGGLYFSKPEDSSRASFRKAAGIEEEVKQPESKSKPIRDIIDRFQNAGEDDKINTLKGLGEEIRNSANKTKNEVLGQLASEIEDAVDHGVEIEDAQDLVKRAMADLEREANKIDSPKEKKTTTTKKTLQDKANEVFGSAAESLRDLWEQKILDPREYQKRVKAGLIVGGGEYNRLETLKLPKKVRDLIFSRNGRLPDLIADDLGLNKVDDVWDKISEALQTAEKEKQERQAQEKFEKDAIANLKRIKELEKTNPEAAAIEEEKEVRSYLADRLRREGGYTELPQIIYDAAVNVGKSIARSARDFKSWAGDMLSRLGEGVRGFLHQIYNAISTGGGRFTERGAERGAVDISGDERFKPKAPTEQEAFTKKAIDAFVKNTGKPPTEEQMSQILSRKFPGITSREASDLYSTSTGKPKPPAEYAGLAKTEKSQAEGPISIRSEDQEDQVRRGILTSVVPAGEGTSRQGILDQGNANLRNGANPFDALEKAKQGDFNALATAKAYVQGLAKQVSEALRKYGPQSEEYKNLAKQYQDYYEGIREAGTVASDILRTFQGETDLSDAADIAREYTKVTGEEPTLSQHEQIRKIADKVNTSIKEAGEATQKVRDTLDESLSDVDVKTPESIEESQQQIADLTDAAGQKAKEEIQRLNNELEQTRRDLEEVKKAKETGQDAESLKKYYEAKVRDLKGQLESKPKYGKEVFETARKLVDKWKADAAEAEKELRKQLNQMGSSPDPTIILTLARIMRAHIGELALDFTESSARLIEKFGPKIKPFLKDAWAKAQELIKGEDGGQKAVKTVRQKTAKAKPVEKMTPAEKAAESLRRRIDQAQKKIEDLNSGKVSTPKDVEKVTNDEIKRLESEYEQKKKELADARLKAKQRDLFEKDKIGENLNPEQVKTLWETAKRFYIDKGESDWDKMVNDLASDLGLTPDQVRKGLASPKGAKKASDDMYLKQRSRQIALDEAKRWLINEKASWIGRVFGEAAEKTFKLAIFGHGSAFMGTHAPTVIYTHPKLAFKAWLKGLSYSFRGKNGRIQNIIDNKDLIYRPNWTVARRAGLENDPRETSREGATPVRSDSGLAKALDSITGGRGFDALFHLRQDMFDQAWNQLSVTMKTPEMAQMFADSINNATGFTKGGERTKGILQSPITKVLFFAPKLIASRFKWMIQDPARMLGTFSKMATGIGKVTPEERMSAIYEAKNKAKFLGLVTGTLLANQVLLSVTGSNQKINFTDPKKNDWLAYKGFGYNLATIGAFTRIARLLAQEYNAVFGDLSRLQKARGGREAAMKDAIYTYLRSGFSPITRDIIVGATGKDYLGNVVPWSSQQPDRGRRKLTWGEIIQEQLAPIPLSEAATQKEALPAALKAGSAAFLGARMETPADIAEYEKSLQSRGPSGRQPKNYRNPFGGF